MRIYRRTMRLISVEPRWSRWSDIYYRVHSSANSITEDWVHPVVQELSPATAHVESIMVACRADGVLQADHHDPNPMMEPQTTDASPGLDHRDVAITLDGVHCRSGW